MLTEILRGADDSVAYERAIEAALGPVSNYPHLEYSRHDVRRAGERLAGPILWDDTDHEEIYRTFAIATNWRDSHVWPMRSVRLSLAQRMRKLGVNGVAASRPKRMASIRRKLRVQDTMKLDQINDLGGCRIVTDTIAGVWSIVREVNERFPHPIRGKAYDYVTVGKPDGYRSYHVVFDYKPRGEHDAAYEGRRVELQIRTTLQHSWATAVEAVGMFRGENMKGGEGDPDWRRLFQLMSLEFALAERCEEGVTGSRRERLAEIRDLNERIGALGLLDNIKSAFRYTTEYVQGTDAKYYLIAYDRVLGEVSVTPYGDALVGSLAYDKAEREIEWDERPKKVVLVEIEKISQLADAYPNYFGDVLLFGSRLRDLCERGADEYVMKPQALAPRKPKEKPDMSWMRHPRWRQWIEKDRRNRHR
jgi:hypothetical protein